MWGFQTGNEHTNVYLHHTLICYDTEEAEVRNNDHLIFAMQQVLGEKKQTKKKKYLKTDDDWCNEQTKDSRQQPSIQIPHVLLWYSIKRNVVEKARARESKPELLWWHDQHLNEQNS